jgi:hypothetical protein
MRIMSPSRIIVCISMLLIFPERTPTSVMAASVLLVIWK